ncbi:MAG: hypothetical protein KF878_02105 [Planctomycetes bacterium]|nr:hypothetical protein [Planctomycetota bacterium]
MEQAVEPAPRRSSWRLIGPLLLLGALCCLWPLGLGYRVECWLVHRRTDQVRLHAACQEVLNAFEGRQYTVLFRQAVGSSGLPAPLRPWEPEVVYVSPGEAVVVQLGGTIGGAYGFEYRAGSARLEWFCRD